MSVSKSIFVDAVISSPLLITDKPVLKLRAYGSSIKQGEEVVFTVDAPSLGLKTENLKAKAQESVYVTMDKLYEGEHAMIIRVSASGGSDAIEKKVVVVPSRFLRDELKEVELSPGVSLPDPGNSFETTVRFIPKTRAQYLWTLRSMAYGTSELLESKAAKNIARELLRDYFDEKEEVDQESLNRYQKTSGGLSLLPYSSEDVELSSKIAAVAQNQFDAESLANYLWSVTINAKVTREEAVRASSGLASLGEPVLLRIKQFAALTDLSWREQLAVIRGLEASGDREEARQMMEKMLEKAEENDGKMFIRIASDERSNIQATAEIAALAAKVSDPRAVKLYGWLADRWNDDAMTDLDRAAYLKAVIPTLIYKDVTLGYVQNKQEKKIVLAQGLSVSIVLTAQEVKDFRVSQVDGPVVAVMIRKVATLPKPSSDISLKRIYTKEQNQKNVTLAENEIITIKLTADWKENSPEGCYLVRDHLPAGLSPLVSVYLMPYLETDNWYPTDIEGNAISFVVCKPEKKSETISYRARVVARGSYTAEKAIMQSMESPSIAAFCEVQSVEIK